VHAGGTYGGEAERVHLDAERRNVLLLELSSQMALDKGRLGALLAESASRSTQHDAGWWGRTFPVPPSPTSTSLKVGVPPCAEASAIVEGGLLWWRGGGRKSCSGAC
jgi:hypothetical protein